ncbi:MULTISPECIES: methyltransferase cognate corrinoid protein [Sporomusa]|jgi:trimethylamine corrinoid protein|uniref:Trimethylamine corrinoid protein 2 n=1 Tax=uncultured Sporomusa sp. TaxID=307249 RepID=A0A212LM45_9FIRM|nr:methyltransferase cognate corrinoid protein [Sporomusa sphaeroides]SCM78590.1 Trimethylamine corrinoid protein 2 [uncultured Sporomusa sp.]HML32291.1 methyltransferase cognate corrinoid protein [Sporomusa sphaeroides]
MTQDALISAAIASILKQDLDAALETAKKTLESGVDPIIILSQGYSEGIRQVGDLFGKGRMFLPELISAAEVMKKATAVLDEALQAKGENKGHTGRMIMATVEGDVHDIGKGIVVSLIKTQGIDVIDLGRDVPVATIIEKAEEYQVDIIGTSALLTTTLVEQKKLEEVLKQSNLRGKYKTIVGGAPATQRWADRIGADAYAEDAAEAVTKVLKLLEA